MTALGNACRRKRPRALAHCRYAFATLNLLIDALLLSPVVLLARSVLLPALVAWLLRAPLAEAERALGAARGPARADDFKRSSATTWASAVRASVAARQGRNGVDGRGDGVELREMNMASGGAGDPPRRASSGARGTGAGGTEAVVELTSVYGGDDGSVRTSGNPLRSLV